MPSFSMFIKNIKKIHYGVNTGREIALLYLDKIIRKLRGEKLGLYERAVTKRLLQSDDYSYHIKDIRLPLLSKKEEVHLALCIYQDTYWSYVNCNDRYDEKTFDKCDKFLSEGLYGLVNDRVNVTVEPGDIVIDAGSWIGDFAAYASVKGASAVYAFEPTEQTFEYLKQTAELNKNIIPVRKGLSDDYMTMELYKDVTGSSSGNTFLDGLKNHEKANSEIEVVRLDDFVRENNIPRVDFIKADIEGFERNMLAGAHETLRNFAPKLALCTYHFPDDPEVMASLIRQANPKYNIVQKRMKLFASVPE